MYSKIDTHLFCFIFVDLSLLHIFLPSSYLPSLRSLWNCITSPASIVCTCRSSSVLQKRRKFQKLRRNSVGRFGRLPLTLLGFILCRPSTPSSRAPTTISSFPLFHLSTFLCSQITLSPKLRHCFGNQGKVVRIFRDPPEEIRIYFL